MTLSWRSLDTPVKTWDRGSSMGRSALPARLQKYSLPRAIGRHSTLSGLGAALGEVILEHGGPGLDASLLVRALRKGIPATVHVAIGTDIVHMAPRLDGAALGQATLDDFRTLCGLVVQLDGGVWLNLGSAVIMPEVFLKAVAVARNLGFALDAMTTANLDFQQQYRGRLNVLDRPGGAGIALTGHHELLIPLLYAGVAARLELSNHRE